MEIGDMWPRVAPLVHRKHCYLSTSSNRVTRVVIVSHFLEYI